MDLPFDVAGLGIDDGNVRFQGVEDVGGVVLRGVGDPTRCVLLAGDSDIFCKGGLEGRIRDLEESGAR